MSDRLLTGEAERVATTLYSIRPRWVTISHLAESLRVPRRVVEQSIQEARLAGQPIVSSSDGVKYATDYREVRANAQDLRRRLATQALTAREQLRTARRMEAREQGYDPDRPGLWDVA